MFFTTFAPEKAKKDMDKKNGTRIIGLCLLWICIMASTKGYAQEYEKFFCDSTLRLDYIFSGNAETQSISLDKMNRIPRWYGKRNRLSEVPVEGNGTITVRDSKSGKVIYKQSFSTLFQEWLTYDEAKTTTRAFENVIITPMPRNKAEITVELRDNRREVSTSMTHSVDPADILIRHIGEKNITPYEIISKAADKQHCINIAFIAEGYTEAEMTTFMKDAREATDALFSHEPFKTKHDCFNVIAVKAISDESGTSEPKNGIWRKTALSSHFDTFYSDRYLTTLALEDMHDLLAGTPYEHIIVLVNTEKYGGGGILNSYNLSMTHHQMYRPVVVHEFGHSFAGLADEYAYESEDIPMYPLDVEPWEPNITTKVDFGDKWQDMMSQKKGANSNGIGLYEGAGYSLKGVYRPCENCRMRTNTHPEFCPVCQRAILHLISFYTERK